MDITKELFGPTQTIKKPFFMRKPIVQRQFCLTSYCLGFVSDLALGLEFTFYIRNRS